MPQFRQRSAHEEPHRDVAVSDELFATVSPGIVLCYQTFGDAGHEPLLLTMGLGGPMIWWPDALCSHLARKGFYVIRYDNRDTGLATRVRGRVSGSVLLRAFLGRRVRAPYSIADLAGDAFGLLDHLGIDSAHVTGVSLGGMIAQTMAITRPDRVRSLVSIMSTTGRRTVGWQDPRLLPAMLARASDRDSYVASSMSISRLVGSPAHPEPEAAVRDRAERTFARGAGGGGVLRQYLAVLTQPDRTHALRGLSLPTTVIHGLDDRMVHPSGGRATAQAIRGAILLLVPGMGHDLPAELYETFAHSIRETADRRVAGHE